MLNKELFERTRKLCGSFFVGGVEETVIEKFEKLLPLAKKYGAMIVGLTLDEKGIPETAEERVKIADLDAYFADKFRF